MLTRGLDQEEAMGVLDGALGWLRAQPRAAKTRVGVVGFCMGGALAERWALRGGDLAAVVMFYGSPETDPARLAALRAPLQGHFGADDDGIPAKKVEELRGGLAAAGKTAEIFSYPGAGHAFMHEGRDSFRPDQARQAWARTLSFLQKHLKG
ncbi:MAG: dienelactone hydrolase family protein [Candidatus Eisenbacteria bacterium]|nr:dienelactone hydrolase family protein [Candidatus Eisenbacteria bacterium]